MLAVLLLSAGFANAAPISGDKLALLPWMWPREKEALQQKLAAAGDRPVEPILRAEGVDPRALDLLARLPDGPRFAERYLHRLPLQVRGLGERQRALLRTLADSLDGAQLTLDQAGAKLDAERRALAERRIATLERRFWLLVGHTLDADQRVDLKDLLPEAQHQPPNVLGHLFLLADLTPSQANRTISMIREYESEIAPDQADAHRLRTLGKQAEARAAERRVQDRYKELYDEVRRVFTTRQWTELRGLMPYVPPEDRKRHPGEIVKAAHPREDQLPRLKELGKRIEEVHARVSAEAGRKRDAMAKEIGEESPQAMTMKMMGASAEGQVVAVMAEAAHEALVEILDPEQVVLWLLGEG